MKLASILAAEPLTTARQREQCRNRLADLRLAQGRARERLLSMCQDLQNDPDSLDPEAMSSAIAELRYLEARSEQLQRLIALSTAAESGADVDF